MQNTLYNAAKKFGELCNKGYHIVLGRKNQMYRLDIRFPAESFYHLIGLQHLEDLTFPSKNKERIYKEILSGRITQEFIEKSIFYKEWNIEERTEVSIYLEEMLDHLPQYFRINLIEFKKNTRIKADYLALLHSSENEKKFVYYFLIHSYLYELPNRFVSCSLFRKQDKDYLRGTSKTTILLMEKIVNIDKNEVIELYRNPNYKDKEESSF